MFDTHVHFEMLQGGDDPAAESVERARAAGVTRLLAVGHSPAANRFALEFSRRFPDAVRAAVGLDREEAGAAADLAAIEAQAADPACVAIGEIGLDFHYRPETAAAQECLLERMLELARRARKPVLVHSRDADETTLRLLRAHVAAGAAPAGGPGALHCFTGTKEFARAVLDLGFCISLSGILTFRNARSLHDVAGLVPEDRLLVETDSPWLAPVPHRGRPNEPAFLPHVVAALAEIRGWPVEKAARVTCSNACRLFQ